MPAFPKCLPSAWRTVARSLLASALLGNTTSCIHRTLEPAAGLNAPAPAPAIAQKTGIPWTSGNHIRTLINGDQFYPPMLEAIRSAEKTITFETFAYVPGFVANDFTTALANKAKDGVNVHLILDAIGSAKLGSEHLTPLRQCGVQVHLYHPYHVLNPWRSNFRTHRKILVVDGHTAFTGGAGFADSWLGHAQSPKHWRDTQYRIEGPAVAQLQHTFNDNWKKLTGQTLTGSHYFPPLTKKGPYRAQFVPDSPRDPSHPLAHSVLIAINAAQKSLALQQSYFIPNPTFRRALVAAANRGVRIDIIVPGKLIDSRPSRYASQNHWAELLRAGIRLHQYETSMMHGKLLVADSRFTIVGSGNLDDRSFFINDEVNLHVDSPAFAREQLKMFRHDLSRCTQITLQNLPSHLEPALKRFASGLLAPQL
ncbi:MAG: phospholipase D-like domain-containing protein [Verrucomicrobiaceae bacterium]